MSILSIAAKDSGLSFDGLEKAALQVGGDISLIGVSASGSADAMTGLYKAGLTTTEIFGDLNGYMAGTTKLGGALRAAIDLAAASELDMVQASDLAAISLATFGSGLKTAEERAEFVNFAMDNLVKASDASVAEVDELAASLTMVGPSASQLGIGIADVNNALALLSEGGIKGTRAGSNLDAMLRSLSDPTDKAQDSLDALGVTMFDAEGNFKALPTIIGEMENALAGMTDEQKSAALGAIFTAQGQRAMNQLLIGGAKGWDEMTEATANAAGIEEQAAAKANTLAGAQEALEGALETLKITAAKQLLPALTDLTRWAAEMVTKYGPPVVAFVGRLIEGFRSVVDVIEGFKSGELNLGDMLPPEVMTLWEAFQGHLDMLREWWDKHGPGIMETARKLGKVLMDAFRELASKVLPWVAERLEKFGVWFTENGPLIEEFVDVVAKAFGIMVTEIVKAWEWIRPILDLIIDNALYVGKIIMQVATGDWAGAWDTIVEMVLNAWELIKESFVALANWVTGWFGSDWAAVTAQWSTNWELFKTIVSTVWESIVTTIKTAIENIGKFIDGLVRKFTNISLPKWMGGSGESSDEADTMPSVPELPERPAGARWSADWEQPSGGATTNNYFNQTVNTQATSPSVSADYRLMQARIGAA